MDANEARKLSLAVAIKESPEHRSSMTIVLDGIEKAASKGQRSCAYAKEQIPDALGPKIHDQLRGLGFEVHHVSDGHRKFYGWEISW